MSNSITLIQGRQCARPGTPGEQHVLVALRGSWEIEALADLIERGVRKLSANEAESLHLLSMARRIRRISYVQMDALGDFEGYSADELNAAFDERSGSRGTAA